MDLCKYAQLILDKGVKIIQWRRDSLFNKWLWTNWTSPGQKMNLDLNFAPYIKINSKWTVDLNGNIKP